MPGVVFDQSLLYLYICNALILVELKDEEPEGAERPQKLSLRARKMRRAREGCAGGTKAPWKADLRAVCSATWEPALQTGRTRVKEQAGRVGGWCLPEPQKESGEGYRGGKALQRSLHKGKRRMSNAKRTFGSDNEKIGKPLDSQMILILFNPKEVTKYKIQLLKFK